MALVELHCERFATLHPGRVAELAQAGIQPGVADIQAGDQQQLMEDFYRKRDRGRVLFLRLTRLPCVIFDYPHSRYR